MNHRESYVGTAMFVWLIATIFCFFNVDDPNISVFSLKTFFFLIVGVFFLSSFIGYLFAMLFGYATSVVLKNSDSFLYDPDEENIALILKIGRIIKYSEAVIVFIITMFCFKAIFVL